MADVINVITVADDTTTLKELLARVAAGEEVVIMQDGTVVARLIPAERMPTPTHPVPTRPRQFGLYAGWGTLDPEFFEPLPEEELRLWEGADE